MIRRAGQERALALMAVHPARFLQFVQRPADGDQADAGAARQLGVSWQLVARGQAPLGYQFLDVRDHLLVQQPRVRAAGWRLPRAPAAEINDHGLSP